MDIQKSKKERAEKDDRIALEVFAPVYPYVAEKAISRTGIRSGSLLDVGCGGGYLGMAVMEMGEFSGVFLDINEEILPFAEKHLQERKMKGILVAGDVQEMPFESESFDLVVSRGSMPFWENQEQAFQEIRRVLKPEGRAYIGVGYGSSELRERIRRALNLKEGEPGGPRSRGMETKMYPDNTPYIRILEKMGVYYKIFDRETDNDSDGRWFLFGKTPFQQDF